MKRVLLSLLAVLCITASSAQEKKVKVACVGNSITYGAYIEDREHNSYPAQLQRYLGDGFQVRNFGVNGATALRRGDKPYVGLKAYEESKSFQPDIVIIKLGTNDTKPWNWKYKEEYMDDYQSLIDSYRQLDSHPRIILLTPVRCFLPEDGKTISPKRIETEVRPMVEALAFRNGLDIINMFNLFGDTWNQAIMPDKLHPSAYGAGSMALKIYNHLMLREEGTASSSTVPFYKRGAETFNFHGYTGYNFLSDGVQCKVVEPKVVAEGKPWIWRARFWEHEPQTDIELLEHGYHLVYCDVADLFGAPEAVKRWDMFYKHMREAGFSKKVALEGLSRGGLIIYNWAARNPRKVACIYADAPVMDFMQWPISTGSEKDVRNLLKAYGFSNVEEAAKWNGNPVDHARVMAKAKIPILHVVGDADEAVLYEKNTKIFEQEMKRLGAPIKVIHKPATGHHPHSLNNPQPIVDFILQAMNQ